MPPFRVGLVKRKNEETSLKKTEAAVPPGPILQNSNESESGDDTDSLLRPVLHDSDSDREDTQQDVDNSDDEQDSVLYGEDDGSGTEEGKGVRDGGEGEQAWSSSESSELSDSEDDEEKCSAEGEGESGIEHTHSDTSVNEDTQHTPSVRQTRVKRRSSHTNRAGTEEHSNTALDKLQVEINKKLNTEEDEYASGDSSDEEDRRTTVGSIPAWWYDDYPHVGYDLDGRRILKPPQRDRIDNFLKQCEDPEFWRTVRDARTGQDVVLSKEDLQLLQRIKLGQAPSEQHDEYAPWVEWFSREVLATPVRAFPEHKRSFLPSQSEQKQISRLVHALKMGWIKTRKQEAEERRKKRERQFYNLWGSSERGSEEGAIRGVHKHIPAPRRPLPGHAESYNPPPEYLLDNKEMKEWNKLKTTPWKRKYTFLPTKFSSLRAVPAYERYIRERFLRCLDLYLAPRAIKMRLTIEPQDLVPKLPSPRDLQPFPTTESVVYRSHTDAVRSVDTDVSGQYLVSASDDHTVKVWEVSTGRCLRTIKLDGSVVSVAWTPVAGLSLVAACVGQRLLLLNPGAGVGDHRVAQRTDDLLSEPPPHNDVIVDERTATAARWERVAPEDWVRGVRIAVQHFKDTKHVQWHGRGDYLVVTMPDGASRSVVVHQLSRRRSQLPFSKAKGLVQCALFHPVRPFLFVATQRAVRVYDLVKQELVRKLLTGAQWISTMAVHPAGDNLLVASYDRKMMWFDLDLSSSPYQTLRLHGAAVRAVAFHKRYPLFASAGDDLKLVVSHGMVYKFGLDADVIRSEVSVLQRKGLKPAPRSQARGGPYHTNALLMYLVLTHWRYYWMAETWTSIWLSILSKDSAVSDLLQSPLLVPLKQLWGHERRDELGVLALCFHPTQPWLFSAGADHTLRLFT